jgi:hypothetical protein
MSHFKPVALLNILPVSEMHVRTDSISLSVSSGIFFFPFIRSVKTRKALN